MGLKGYIAKRTAYSFIVLFGVMTANFVIFSLMPGDPMAQYTQSLELKLTRNEIKQIRELFGLDMPLHERYILYIKNMLTWNFGKTRETGIPIAEEMTKRLENSLILMTTAAVLSISIGTLLGTLLAYKRGTSLDTAGVTGALVLGSLPVFFIGILILWFFAVQMKWFPITAVPRWPGGIPPTNPLEIIAARLYCITMPVLALIIFSADGWALLTRACVLQTITEDYVVTARAKGLKERQVLLKHVLKPASLPLVTAMAMTFAGLFSGAIITETVFSYEGMGRWILHAISNTDLPILYVIFYISALLIIIANFMVDLVYGLIDPRIKVG
jgi:peptide/nickel transport system permease protein